MEDLKNKNWFFAVIGAIIGGVVTGGIILGVLFSKGLIGSTTGVGGQRVIVNTLDEATQVEAVAQVIPASVVGVQSTVTTTGFWGQMNQGISTGSGFIVTSDGYIVTNQHVVSNGKNITVSLADDSTYDAKVIWSDDTIDLAVLKIKASGLPAVSLGNSDEIRVGQAAIAIGNPTGLNYARSVTAGIISALKRSLVVDSSTIAEDLIQTDATINAGNSGGPLCNGKGEVIGINTYKNYDAEGMGFALPVNIIKPIINKIIASGSFEAVKIGIDGFDKTLASYYYDAPQFDTGIYVSRVESGKGAANAGIQKGDIITAVDDVTVNSMLDLKTYIYAKNPGESVNITYTRNGSSHTAECQLYK